MVLIPEREDPTLEALNRALEAEQQPYTSRNIGFGEIGHECSRYLWYKINATEGETFDAATLRCFSNGHDDEAKMAGHLRKVKGIELYTHDPNRENKQYKLDALGGRFTGRLDGVIVGLLQAPETPHVFEHKSANEKKYNELLKLKAKVGEKNALREWDFKYFSQAQACMKYAELTRHYMTIGTPGLRQVTSLRTEYDAAFADSLERKAERIINAKSPPERIGGADYFMCRNCRFYGECHGDKGS